MSNPNSPQQIHEDDSFVATVVDLGQNVQVFAREAANNKLHEKIDSGNGLSRFVKRIWHGNIARDLYLERYTSEARNQILESGDLYVNEKVTDHEQAELQMRQAVTSRFVSEYDDVIREGEDRQEVGDEAEAGELKNDVRGLIAQYARGELDEDTFQEEKMRLLQGVIFKNGTDRQFEIGAVYADNLLNVARQVRARFETDQGQVGVEELLQKLRLNVGEARVGASSEIRKTLADKIVEKASGKILVNEATLGTAVAIATSIAKWGASAAVGTTRVATLGLSVGGGVLAGVRENARVKEERVLHSRDVALGRNFDAEGQRSLLNDSVYEARSADEMRGAMRAILDEEGVEVREGFSDTDFMDAIAVLADTSSRIRVSDLENVDHISFSSIETSEMERTQMMIQLCTSRVRLREWFNRQTSDRKARLTGDDVGDFDSLFDDMSAQGVESLHGEMSDRDQVFNKMRRMRVARAAAIAATAGTIAGLGMQETVAVGADGTQGMIERLWQHNDGGVGTAHQTQLDSLFHSGGSNVQYEAMSLTGHSTTTQGPNALGTITLDDAFKVSDHEGQYSVTAPNGETVDGIRFGADGVLTTDSQKLLESHHFSIKETKVTLEKSVSRPVTTNAKGFVANHKAEMTHITRDGWWDNDTPKTFDHNELKMHWGGEGGTGIDAHGNYVYDVQHMTKDGSWHQGETADWHKVVANGDMKVAISLSGNTQKDVFMVDINERGQAVIPKGSLAAKAFSMENGHAVFHGKYAEVAQVTSVDGQGVTHIRPFATDSGEGIKQINDISIKKEPQIHHAYKLEYAKEYSEPVSTEVLVGPNIPIIPREALAPWRRAERRGGYYYDGGYGEMSPEEVRKLRDERSPRLLRDRDAVLNPRQEIEWYKNKLVEKKGKDYAKEIENVVDATPELRDLPKDIKTIYTVPVAAAQESENIYSTLSLYGQQDEEALKKAVVILHVNWFADLMNNPDSVASIRKTQQEIERARRDFPDLNIAVIETQYDRAEVMKTGGVIGYVAKKMMDTALLSVARSMERGEIPSTHDVLLVRNDADMFGLGRHHMMQMQKGLDTFKGDILKGSTRFGVKRHQQYPGFGIVTNFSSAMTIASAGEGSIHTGGANFGIRASTAAAVCGLGFDSYTGAGSDDVNLGRRVDAARRDKRTITGKNLYSRLAHLDRARSYSLQEESESDKKYVQIVAGASVDTNPDRLIPHYLDHRSFQDAWDNGRFDAGGYAARDVENHMMERIPREDIKNDFDRTVSFIETNIAKELLWGNKKAGNRALSLFFGNTPNAYIISRDESKVEFHLTKNGRDFIKRCIERESNGRYGSYGARKMRQLYGVANGKRQPVTAWSPLVSPL